MLRVILIAIAGASLGSCSSFSLGDYFKSTPPSIQIQLESNPSGADARTSVGPGCKTPCSVAVAAPDTGFSVTYTLNKYQSTTVPVNVIYNPGEFGNPATTVTDPNPVFAELQPARPLPSGRNQKKKAASATGSPFPDPSAPPPSSRR